LYRGEAGRRAQTRQEHGRIGDCYVTNAAITRGKREEEKAMPDTTKSEAAPDETVICLYPGCDREAVPVPNPDSRRDTRQGPPPRYCDDDGHNAASAYQELKRIENEAAADQPA
jgi:hypothetical protein